MGTNSCTNAPKKTRGKDFQSLVLTSDHMVQFSYCFRNQNIVKQQTKNQDIIRRLKLRKSYEFLKKENKPLFPTCCVLYR